MKVRKRSGLRREVRLVDCNFQAPFSSSSSSSRIRAVLMPAATLRYLLYYRGLPAFPGRFWIGESLQSLLQVASSSFSCFTCKIEVNTAGRNYCYLIQRSTQPIGSLRNLLFSVPMNPRLRVGRWEGLSL